MYVLKAKIELLEDMCYMINSGKYEIISAGFNPVTRALEVLYFDKDEGRNNATLTARLIFEET